MLVSILASSAELVKCLTSCIGHGVIENTGHNGIIDANTISGYSLRIAYLISFHFLFWRRQLNQGWLRNASQHPNIGIGQRQQKPYHLPIIIIPHLPI
jgi:hypothetical protein